MSYNKNEIKQRQTNFKSKIFIIKLNSHKIIPSNCSKSLYMVTLNSYTCLFMDW